MLHGRPSLTVLALLLCAAPPLAADAEPQSDDDASPPNIIFIFTDDHAVRAVSAYGSPITETPNIDRLADEGMRFDRAFVTNSICAPSRSVVLTGMHSHVNGVPTNRESFDPQQRTFPKLLRESGYQTAIIGKWHLKTEPSGFDHWEVLIGQGPYYNPPLRTPGGTERHTGYTTDIITDRTLHWLKNERDTDTPFMLMYQHKAPHRNWQPGPDHLTLYDDVHIPEPETLFDDYSTRASAAREQEMTIAEHMYRSDLKLNPPGNLTDEQLQAWNAAYEPKNDAFREADLDGRELVRWKYQRYIKDYLRTIASVDDNLGRVLDYLDEAGLAENTVVVYTSDQGFFLGEHGWYDKRFMYEPSLQIPLVVRWPKGIDAGAADDHLVQNLDFAPTFLDLAGTPVPDDMHGRSLAPLLRGESPSDWRDAIYYHYYEFPAVHNVQRHYGIRTDRYKLIHYYLTEEWELFDLERDPHEVNNIYDDPGMAEIVESLKTQLRNLQEEVGDTKPEAPLALITQRHLRDAVQSIERETVFDGPPDSLDDEIDLDPSKKPLTVRARVSDPSADGVVLAHGGMRYGYVLYLEDGVPHFGVRNNGAYLEVAADAPIESDGPVTIEAMLDAQGVLHLLVDDRRIAEAFGQFIETDPAEGLSIGEDAESAVGPYDAPFPFAGRIERITIGWGAPDPKDVPLDCCLDQ